MIKYTCMVIFYKTLFIRTGVKRIKTKRFFLMSVLFILGVNGIFAQITTSKTDVSCHGCSDGTASASVSGGTPPYEYKWSNGATGSSISGLAPGTYSVFITDANKCTGSASVTINDKPKPPDPFDIPVFAGGDPNDITGPAGYGEPKWVSVNDVLPYTIRFENDPKIATSAVNKVVVTHPIDKMANMFTFQLGNITFRDFTVEVPPNTSHFYKRLNLVDSIGVYLDITAGLDVTKNQAFWIFQAFDPVTGLPNINPNLGFLLINDSITHNGEGSVSFSIKPKINAKTGDSIKAYADIVFDTNDAIRTNIAFNTIDALPPVSVIKSIAQVDPGNIRVFWKGNDDKGGCGIAKYILMISTNDAPYITYADGIADTSAVVSVLNGSKYKIQTVASDHVNNTEPLKSEPDTTIEVKPVNFFITPNYASKVCTGNQLVVSWHSISDIVGMYLQVSADSGKTYISIGYHIFISDSVFIWNIPAQFTGNKYCIIRAVNSANDNPFAISDYFLLKNNINVYAGEDKGICQGDSALIGGSPTASNGIAPYTYQWLPSEGLNYANISNPFATQGGNYIVSVTDSLGCSNSDTVRITMNALPYVYAYGLDSTYYINSVKDTLYGYPEGGIFSGAGIAGNVFDPASAGAGPHAIIYTYTNEYGCSGRAVNYTKVLPLSNAEIIGLDSTYCVNALSDTLTGIPAGGVFSGHGIVNNTFSPALAGEGTHEITYTYIDSTGVSTVAVARTIVYPLPLVSFKGLDSVYCINADTVSLTGVPSGGVFSGNGVVGNRFIPSVAGVGAHQITYSYISQNGCSNNQVRTVTVKALPNVSFTGLKAQYCLGADTVELTGAPLGGIFSGAGGYGNSFVPADAGLGAHTITYSYTDQNGCSGSATQTVTVNALPTVSLTGLKAQYCLDADTVELAGIPAGGVFSGAGVYGNSFVPADAGLGIHTITYSYTDQNGCSGSATQTVSVNALPTVSFTGLNAQYCIDADTIELTGTPAGGVFSGDGIFDNFFVPAEAGLGIHTIIYSYTDKNGCAGSATQTVTVNVLPTVSFAGLKAQYCLDADTVELTGTPAGGVFSGDGIFDNFFVPAEAGLGIHAITYSYADQNGCSGSATQTVTVNVLPTVSFAGLKAQYCNIYDTVALTGTPSGGTFTGDGITGNIFNPSLAGVGTHQITYSYTDANGCSGKQTQTVTVNTLPTVSFTGLTNEYYVNDPADTLTGYPSGGTFSGDGMNNNIFTPSVAGVGTHIITYTYSNNGCTNSYSQSTTVKVQEGLRVTISAVNPTCHGACNGSATAIVTGGSGNYLYIWVIVPNYPFNYTFRYGRTINNLCAGQVTVYIFDLTTHKRVSNSITLIDPPALQLELSYNNTTSPKCNKNCTGNAKIDESKIGGEAPYTYAWFMKANGWYKRIDGNSNVINQLCVGNYKIKVTDANNCSEERYFAIKCVHENNPGHKPNFGESDYMVVYPNPAKDVFTIELHLIEDSEGEINMFDMLGKKVKQVKQGILLSNEKVEVDVSELAKGIYTLQVLLENDILLEKVIISSWKNK